MQDIDGNEKASLGRFFYDSLSAVRMELKITNEVYIILCYNINIPSYT